MKLVMRHRAAWCLC